MTRGATGWGVSGTVEGEVGADVGRTGGELGLVEMGACSVGGDPLGGSSSSGGASVSSLKRVGDGEGGIGTVPTEGGGVIGG